MDYGQPFTIVSCNSLLHVVKQKYLYTVYDIFTKTSDTHEAAVSVQTSWFTSGDVRVMTPTHRSILSHLSPAGLFTCLPVLGLTLLEQHSESFLGHDAHSADRL